MQTRRYFKTLFSIHCPREVDPVMSLVVITIYYSMNCGAAK